MPTRTQHTSVAPGAPGNPGARPRWALGVAVVIAFGVALGAALAGPGARAEEGRRSGKDVRVAREWRTSRSEFKLCRVVAVDEGRGFCQGSAPRVGSRAQMFDYEGQWLAEIQVDRHTEPTTTTACTTLATFAFSVVQGDLSQHPGTLSFVVFGAPSSQRRVHMIWHDDTDWPGIPALERGEPFLVMDTDGNGDVDHVTNTFECTDLEPPPRNPSPGRRVEAMCDDYWVMEPDGWRKVRRDTYHYCL